ncbi:MAG: PCRF domain-containing protein [Syntrophobacteraceae bacterium]|nr:PCRF domain-containing protein [Syntrophobacteraceae bacterium]
MDKDSDAVRTDFVTIERERYEQLLIELGELRKLKEIVHEYKSTILNKDQELKEKDRELEEIKEILLETEWRDYELEQTQKRLRELDLELKTLRAGKSWWKKLTG